MVVPIVVHVGPAFAVALAVSGPALLKFAVRMTL